MNAINTFSRSILGGVSISIGCVVYLSVGGVAGAVLFAFGLTVCILFGFPLYTGTVGFIERWSDVGYVATVLAGNITGCIVMAIGAHYALPDILPAATAITVKRTAFTPVQMLILAALCGFIMTAAVKFGKEGKYLPLIFGVPLFILSGFVHSIADAFYLSASDLGVFEFRTVGNYLLAVAGNAIGCNLWKMIRIGEPRTQQ